MSGKIVMMAQIPPVTMKEIYNFFLPKRSNKKIHDKRAGTSTRAPKKKFRKMLPLRFSVFFNNPKYARLTTNLKIYSLKKHENAECVALFSGLLTFDIKELLETLLVNKLIPSTLIK